MEAKIEEVKEHYIANLKADAYCEMLKAGLKQSNKFFRFILESVRTVIKSGRFKGTKLLEVGSGATVHNIAIASEQFNNIVQSDLVPDNLLELKKWHKGESSFDWSPYLDIVAELEGYSDLEEGKLAMEARIRSSVKEIVRCDIFSNSVLSMEELTTPETQPPYDVLMTTLVLSASTVDFESYLQVLRRFHGLLRQGGGLIIVDTENGGPWYVEGMAYNHARLSISEMIKALGMAGFGNLEMKVQLKEESHYHYDFETLLCIAAEKL